MAALYDGARLEPGMNLEGPAIIEESGHDNCRTSR